VRARLGRVLLVVASLDLLVYGLLVLLQWLVGDEPVDWVRPIGTAAGPFLGTVLGLSLLEWWRRRRAGEPERQRLRPILTATRTGRLPAGVDVAVWASVLAREAVVQRRRMSIVPGVLGVLALVLLALLLLLTDAGLGSVLLCAAVSVQLITLVWAAGQRHQRRIAGLLERLPAPADRSAAD